MTEPLWRLNNVSVSGRRSPRLDHVTLEIPPGITAVLGSSGAGKTSLLNLLVGFERPTTGTLIRNNTRPMVSGNSGDSSFVAAKLQIISQRLPVFWSPPGHGLWPQLTVREHVESLMSELGRERTSQADALLEAFDLMPFANTHSATLSQGERDRLSLARAIASRAEVLVLDEPLIHVSSHHARNYWRHLQCFLLAKSSTDDPNDNRRETSVVLATHDPTVVLREAEHVICLDDGRVVYAGNVHELYHSPQTEQQALFLGPINRFDENQRNTWLPNPPGTGDLLIRPEHLQLHEDEAGSLQVVDSCCTGPITETTLRATGDSESKTVWHVSSPRKIVAGMRVSLKVLLALFLLAILGCRPATSENSLPVVNEEIWTVPPDGAKIPAPRGILAGPQDELFVLDNAGRVLVYNTHGEVTRQWWMPEYSVGKPEGICVLQDGRIAVADTHYHRVVFFDHDGTFQSAIGKLGREPGEFIYPVKVIQDPQGDLYVCEYGENDRVQKFRPDGKFLLQFGSFGTEPGQFQRPSGIAWFDHQLYIVDAFNNRIQVFQEDGKFVGVLAAETSETLYYPYDISVTSQGEFFIAEYGGGRVSKWDRTGRLLGRYGSPGVGHGQFSTPWGITVDAAGRVFVADTGNRRVVVLGF